MTDPAFVLPAEPPPPPSSTPTTSWSTTIWVEPDHPDDTVVDLQVQEDTTRLLQAVLAVVLAAVAMTVGWAVAGPLGAAAGCAVLAVGAGGVLALGRRVATARAVRRLRLDGGPMLAYEWRGVVCQPLPVGRLADMMSDGRLSPGTPVRGLDGTWVPLGEVVRRRLPAVFDR
ncbi:hypothetical protein GCM10023340_30740 [Nocardioides marinquilinus]|uniref:Uncharacterized protein n=1 Tax=Nocardioides marinquilinus TaxID=1210400 RepID=A0ABP9PXV1_9ACTN